MDQFLRFPGQRWDFLPSSPVAPTSSTSRHFLPPNPESPNAKARRFLWNARNSPRRQRLLQIFLFRGIEQDAKYLGIDFVPFRLPIFQTFDGGSPGRRTAQTRNSDKTLANRIVNVDTIC